MAHAHAFDRELLHSWLWVHRDGRGFVGSSQARIAKTLGCGSPTVSRLFGELTAAGKLTKHGNKFRVINPEDTPILN